MKKRIAALVAATLGAALLAGCQDPVPTPQALPKAAEPPLVLESGQIERILSDLSSALAEGAEAGNVAPLERRVAGAALIMADAQFKTKAADPEATILELGYKFADGGIVTRSVNWPRSFVVVTEYADAEAPLIYQIEQADARSPYKLVAWAKMLAGADLPASAPAEVGTAPVTPSAEGLTLTPQAAVQAYAVAKDDTAAPEAGLFDTAVQDGIDPDPARARWLATIKALSDGVAEFSGTVAHSSAVVEGSIFALATADSGALVFAQITSTAEATFTPPEGGSVDLWPRGYAGVEGETLNATKSARIEHLQTVVLAVPPAGSDQLIRVIAVADTPVAVEVE